MSDDSFNAWQWDREQFDAGNSRFSVQRHGRTVSFDRFGVSIDGHRIVRDDLKQVPGDRGFAVRADGAVLYRQQVVATIAAPTGSTPGEVTICRADGPGRQQAAADRSQPDTAPAAPRQAQQERDRYEEQEMDL